METTAPPMSLSEAEQSDIFLRRQKFRLIRVRSCSLQECAELVRQNDKAGFRQDKYNWLTAIQQHVAPTSFEIATQLFEFFFAEDDIERAGIIQIWKKLASGQSPQPTGDRNLAMLWRQLGVLETGQGHLDLAQEYFLKAIEVQKELKDSLMLGNDYFELGLVYRNLGDYQRAWEAFNTSVQYAQEAKNLHTVIYSQGQLANVLAVQSRFGEAVDILKKSLETWDQFQAESDRDMRHTTLHTLGRTYLQNGQYKEAKDVLLESLRLKEKIQERFDATLRTRAILAEACINLGEYEEAETYLNEEIVEKGENIGSFLYAASAYKALSQLNFAQKKFAEATRLANRAMATAEKSNTPLTEFEVALWLLSSRLRRLDLFGFLKATPFFVRSFFRLRLSPLEIVKLTLKRFVITIHPMRKQNAGK